MKKLLSALLFSLVLVSAGCSASYKSTLAFNPSEPIRIAVLPFAQIDADGKLTRADQNFLIDNVALVSTKLKQTPPQFVQNLVQSELSQAALDVIPPALVDAELIHAGFGITNSHPVEIDLSKVFAASPGTICSQVLSCDALLYGKITSWQRSYYGIQSVATVGLSLQLVSARTNKVLYEIEAQDSDSRGISKGPTGFSNLVIEPLKGLDNEIISDLARNLVKKALEPLSQRSRPEFLTSPAPFILASAHDSRTGLIPKNGRLIVVAFGSAEQTASFDVDGVTEGVPLLERAGGHYIGEFVPLKSDSFRDATVTVTLRDRFGRKTSQKLSKIKVSY